MHVRGVESARTSPEDVAKRQFRQVWVSALRAEMDGQGNAGTLSTGTIPEGGSKIMAKRIFSSKPDAEGLITKARSNS